MIIVGILVIMSGTLTFFNIGFIITIPIGLMIIFLAPWREEHYCCSRCGASIGTSKAVKCHGCGAEFSRKQD